MPKGFTAPEEARLGDTEGLLSPEHRDIVTSWWLAVRARANTPNWDIASTASIDGTQGLVLIEAKAHAAELKRAGHGIRNQQNLDQIRGAVEEANAALEEITPGWCLSCDSHYQLANRFAWSWKVASLGIPVLLVYLGFLNAVEMVDQGEPFADAGAWEGTMRSHAAGVAPENFWEEEMGVYGTSLRAITRSVEVPLA